MLQPIGSQRVGNDLVTEQQQIWKKRQRLCRYKLSISTWAHYPGLLRWALNAIINILITESQENMTQRQERRRQSDSGGRAWPDAATSQGVLAVPRSWRSWATNSLRPLGIGWGWGASSALLTPWFPHNEMVFGLLDCRSLKE